MAEEEREREKREILRVGYKEKERERERRDGSEFHNDASVTVLLSANHGCLHGNGYVWVCVQQTCPRLM